MKIKLPYHFCIRLLSLLGVFIVLVIDCFRGAVSADSVFVGLFLSSSILLIYPASSESSLLSLVLSVVLLSSCVIMRLLDAGMNEMVAVVSCVLTLLTAVKGWVKFSSSHRLFKAVAVWQGVEDYSRLFYLILLVVLSRFEAHQLIVPVFLALYYRAYSGRTLFIRRKTESGIKDLMNGIIRPGGSADCPDNEMNGKYAQIQRLMTEEKRYLDPGLTMRDLCMATFSNRNYLSRTINLCSGKNFSRYVNYYRVMHAVDLIDSDPSLKVFELASMSGFSNTVTFNSAFKDFMHESPGEYIRRKQSMCL